MRPLTEKEWKKLQEIVKEQDAIQHTNVIGVGFYSFDIIIKPKKENNVIKNS